jgi:hypothetical protein
MTRWAVVATAVLMIALGSVAGTAVRVAHERDDARASAVAFRQRLEQNASALRISNTLVSRYRRLTARGEETIRALRTQVDWDKSHLLDCWTVIVRAIDRTHLRDIFGAAPGYLIHAARVGGTLEHFTRRCASDAVP